MKETSKKRDLALDYTKGILVIGMLFYHAAVFFVTNDSIRMFLTESLLTFVSGSWVFISGLIVTHYYEKKFFADKLVISRILWSRGVKILLLFIALNMIIALLGLSPDTKILTISGLVHILLNGDAVTTSFEILIGIGYVLLLSPLYLCLGRFGLILTGLLLFGVSVAVVNGYSIPPIIWIILCGIGGMIAGEIVNYVIDKYKNLANYSLHLLAASIAGTLLYYYMTFEMGFDKGDIHTYLFGIASILLTIYLSHEWVRNLSSVDSYLRFLGRYSLISYIGQMAILWLWSGVVKAAGIDLPFIVNFAIVMALMSMGIVLVDYARGRLPLVRRVYSSIFA